MHKKFLTSVFALLGGVALVGSGYSAFTFIDSQKTSEVSGSVETGKLFDGMNIAVNKDSLEEAYSTFALKLDQGTPNSTNVSEGVTIDGEESVNVDLKVSFDKYDGLQDILDTNTVTLKWNVQLTGAVASYVELTGTTTGTKNITQTNDLPNGSITFDVTLAFQYKATKKPTTAALVETMSSTIREANDAKLVFTVDCDFGEKTI